MVAPNVTRFRNDDHTVICDIDKTVVDNSVDRIFVVFDLLSYCRTWDDCDCCAGHQTRKNARTTSRKATRAIGLTQQYSPQDKFLIEFVHEGKNAYPYVNPPTMPIPCCLSYQSGNLAKIYFVCARCNRVNCVVQALTTAAKRSLARSGQTRWRRQMPVKIVPSFPYVKISLHPGQRRVRRGLALGERTTPAHNRRSRGRFSSPLSHRSRDTRTPPLCGRSTGCRHRP